MITDTIMVRVDTEKIRSQIAKRAQTLPEAGEQHADELLERLLLSLQRHIEEEVSDFEKGNGSFESCFYEAL